MVKFSDISFKNKIYGLLLLPILGFLSFSFLMIKQSYVVNNEMDALLQLTKLSVTNSQLVHELQKERGATAGFIGSKGEKFNAELKAQRKLTDEKFEARRQFMTVNNFDEATIATLNQQVAQALNELKTIRNRVDSFDIQASQAIGYYTKTNAKLLSVSSLIVEVSTDSDLSKQITAYYNFLQGKERAGIERAVMSNTFATDKFTGALYIKFIALITEQNTYFSNFLAFASKQNIDEYHKQLAHDAVTEVERLRTVAKSTNEGFGVDAVHWFKQATLRIGQLKKIENALAESLLGSAQIKQDSSFNAFVINIIILVSLLALVAFICIISMRDLMSRVNELTVVMGKVRHDNDLRVRTTLEGESELGHISTALNLTLEQFSTTINEISKSSITLSAAAEETSTTCDINSVSMSEQQEGIATIAAAVEQLSATVKEVASNTQLTADSARSANEQATEGLDVVKLSYSSIENLSHEIDSLAEQISNLHNSSNNITKVVDVIKSVADQTNLLALNAAIEAARAGEHGRGFAVVADEVRTLAQRTQESTAEIEAFITTLQSDADTAYNVIEDSQKKAVEAVEKSKNVEHTLEDITSSIGHIFSMTEQIATAIEEQSVVTDDVAKNIVTIEHKSTEATEGAAQIAMTSKEQAHLATSLQDLANTFKS